MNSRTFVSIEKHRASRDGELGTTDLVRTETVYVDGTVEYHVRGLNDGAYVDLKGTRQHEGPLDLDRVEAARLRSGWTRKH